MFANPWFLLAAVLAVGGAGLAGELHGRSAQKTADFAAAAQQALVDADRTADAVKRATDAARAAERQSALSDAAASAAFQKSLKERSDAKDRVIADLRTGARGLYVRADCPKTGDGRLSDPATAAGRRDGTEIVRLSIETGSDLEHLAIDADAVADQLRACQVILARDRKVVSDQ